MGWGQTVPQSAGTSALGFLKLVFLSVSPCLLRTKHFQSPKGLKRQCPPRPQTCPQLGVSGPLGSPHDPLACLSKLEEPRGFPWVGWPVPHQPGERTRPLPAFP